jgi:hypothetical protein
MKGLRTWIAVAIAATIVLGVVVAIAVSWADIGQSEISLAGWFAMGLGIILTLALGIGLMALVFVSSRRGYDDIGGKEH